MSGPLREEAISTVQRLARELGLECVPAVLAERSNLVLRLDPHPIVARVALATSAVRVGSAWIMREIEIASFLLDRCPRSTRPSGRVASGPFDKDDLIVSFWELETLVPGPVDPVAAGAGLAELHRALASFPRASLPEWGGIEEAKAVYARGSFTTEERARLDAAWGRADEIIATVRSRTMSFQAVHGDAHIGNVLSTERGTLWTDWEDAFVGPIEWDLACLRSRRDLFGEEADVIERTIEAYDGPYDASLVLDLGLLRNLQVIPWLAVFAEREPGLLDRMRARIAKLP